jgi:hypothetical protein
MNRRSHYYLRVFCELAEQQLLQEMAALREVVDQTQIGKAKALQAVC